MGTRPNGYDISHSLIAPGSAFELQRVVINKGSIRLSNPEGLYCYAVWSGSDWVLRLLIGNETLNIKYMRTKPPMISIVEGEKIALSGSRRGLEIILIIQVYQIHWKLGDQSYRSIGSGSSFINYCQEGNSKVNCHRHQTGEDGCDNWGGSLLTFAVEVDKL